MNSPGSMLIDDRAAKTRAVFRESTRCGASVTCQLVIAPGCSKNSCLAWSRYLSGSSSASFEAIERLTTQLASEHWQAVNLGKDA